MRFVSLFAGVGGFDLGFELAGWECVGQVEIDKHCQTVLKRHWPDVPLHDDVTTAKEWADECGLVGNVDVVCGGFPCQDVSVAGKRAGLAGSRTSLFWDAVAFATHVQARWVILENVPGLATSNQGRDFGVVLSALADAGYVHLEWRVLDSQFFGVPQRRRRMFIVGCTRVPSGRPVLLEPEGMRWHPPQGVASWQASAGGVAGGAGGGRWAGGSSGEGVAAPLISNAQGGQRTTDLDGATYVVEEREREIFRILRTDRYMKDTISSTVAARDYKSATDLVVET